MTEAAEQDDSLADNILIRSSRVARRAFELLVAHARIEKDVLAESGLLRDQIRVRDGSKLDGARRPLRVPLLDPALETGDDDRGPFLQLAFTLPPGAYATSVLREIRKRD